MHFMKDITYQISPDIIWKDADGTVYVLQPDTEEIHALNETGSFIWRLINKGYALSKIIIELLAEYDVAEAWANKDVEEFVARYVRENFLIEPKRSSKAK